MMGSMVEVSTRLSSPESSLGQERMFLVGEGVAEIILEDR